MKEEADVYFKLSVKGDTIDGKIHGEEKAIAAMFMTFFERHPDMRKLLKKIVIGMEVFDKLEKLDNLVEDELKLNKKN